VNNFSGLLLACGMAGDPFKARIDFYTMKLLCCLKVIISNTTEGIFV